MLHIFCATSVRAQMRKYKYCAQPAQRVKMAQKNKHTMIKK